jgi:hypothetical protein
MTIKNRTIADNHPVLPFRNASIIFYRVAVRPHDGRRPEAVAAALTAQGLQPVWKDWDSWLGRASQVIRSASVADLMTIKNRTIADNHPVLPFRNASIILLGRASQ